MFICLVLSRGIYCHVYLVGFKVCHLLSCLTAWFKDAGFSVNNVGILLCNTEHIECMSTRTYLVCALSRQCTCYSV